MIDPETKKIYKTRDVWTICIRGNQKFGTYIRIKEDKRKKDKFKIFKDNKNIYYPITKISKEKYNGFIYDLTVSNEHNYVTYFLVKNSGEGFGVPVIEAMACGVPVLITDFTTTKELVTDWQSGEAIKLQTDITGSWTVERGICDINDGAEKIEKLYKDKKLCEYYGQNGMKAVAQEYTWKIVIDKWYKLLEKILE
jgi:glycosyltransferase involved in cell wall biosynthesis